MRLVRQMAWPDRINTLCTLTQWPLALDLALQVLGLAVTATECVDSTTLARRRHPVARRMTRKVHLKAVHACQMFPVQWHAAAAADGGGDAAAQAAGALMQALQGHIDSVLAAGSLPDADPAEMATQVRATGKCTFALLHVHQQMCVPSSHDHRVQVHVRRVQVSMRVHKLS